MDVAALLSASLSPEQQTRATASEQLEQAASQDYPSYIFTLSNELANEQQQPFVRQAAGLAIKNSLVARDSGRAFEQAQRWLALDPGHRTQIKQIVLAALSTKAIGAAAAQVVSAVAAIELPHDQWPELVPTLLSNVTDASDEAKRMTTLVAIGFVCESVPAETLATRSNEILTAVVQGARKEEPSTDVQNAAINALNNSLDFVKENFEREGERNYIMQVICEATQSSSTDVKIGAFKCLVRIMNLYYSKMGFYMERALFGLTVLGMQNPEEGVALQAIEFWSTVCDEEIELALEAQEAAEFGEPVERESKNFAKVALPEILPVLLKLLTQQDEDATDDEWNVSMSAGTCLSLLAQTVTDDIVQPIVPFVESNIRSTDWQAREAAVMAFGSILDGPDSRVLAPLVSQALPTLIEMIRDPSIHVKDTTAWTLGRISDVLIDCIKLDVHLHDLVLALVAGLQDNPRIIGNCCWSLMNLADQLQGIEDADGKTQSSPLSPYYEGILSTLMQVSDRPTNDNNSRTSSYEAISTFITQSPEDSLQTISQVTVALLERMEQLLSMQNQLLGTDDRANWNELQSNLCSAITSVIRRLNKEIKPLADRIMTILLSLISSSGKHSTVLEDAFLAIGAITTALEVDFLPYLEAFMPFLYQALKSHEEYQLCSISVGLIGDICRALGEQSTAYCNNFMNVLLENLAASQLHRSVKPPILSAFGDIGLAIGGQFEPYLPVTMQVLQQAGSMMPDPNNYDLIDYVATLRESILEAYVGIVSGLKVADKSNLLLPYLPSIFNFIQICASDTEHTQATIASAVGLLGDLADAYPRGEAKDFFLQPWVAEILKLSRTRGGTESIRRTAKWAREMIKRATA
ncbi:ARM repeat-containing protein [Wallemia mellicola]|uniref:Importin-95 n=2 Tax=Wallemia mellicola TaxID=1708541 RepID=A0A4T0RXZ1_9BASI|nr:ARM repeat-containing protein [Wallemia mellicola CBS 633.66]TIB74841.1 hypothetical protein E3Q24_00429 [Wallemia mellicola]EIM24156.1 ARM repeat-containing protein [Wallemia mellicola CBS 633.66]TIB79500.1 hypothetical protein E3Q23_00133 [Wallemia mellicola]TIB82657.1 ARM repeat-containing protein [Wallemia mellicola]TIB89448.1 ARM repeat-containing protein [Wallemia mellicola]|eukprot:XP_006955979.1 ARM repeat-containing protein [Wallemia mellicola CBS 633.66]